MIIRGKIDSNSSEKKRLCINNSKGRFSTLVNTVQKSFQEKQKQFNCKAQNCQIKENIQNLDKMSRLELPLIQKQFSNSRLSRSLGKNHLNILETRKSSNLKLQSQYHKRSGNMMVFPLLQINPKNKQKKLLIVQDKKQFSNNRLRLSFLLTQKKRPNDKSDEDHSQRQSNQMFTDPDRENVNDFQDLRQSNPQNHKNTHRKSSYYNANFDKEEQIFFKIETPKRKWEIVSNLGVVMIPPHSEPTCFKTIGTQTIQQQRQFFEYLKYKRRKQQFSLQVEKEFDQLNEIKEDRKFLNQRVESLLSIVQQGPIDEREKRVFGLRKQFSNLEEEIFNTINKKNSMYEAYVYENQSLQHEFMQFASDNIEIIKNYLQIIRSELQKQSTSQKCVRLTKHMQKIIESNFRKTLNKVEKHIDNGHIFKEADGELHELFDDYKKTVLEYKGLLKNCFSHIKKIPQLVYGLYGNNLPKMDLKTQLRNESNEFELPKCMQCFNSEWKFHMIIQKNILMESVLKVTQQLLK